MLFHVEIIYCQFISSSLYTTIIQLQWKFIQSRDVKYGPINLPMWETFKSSTQINEYVLHINPLSWNLELYFEIIYDV